MLTFLRSVVILVSLSALVSGCADQDNAEAPDSTIAELRAEVSSLSKRVVDLETRLPRSAATQGAQPQPAPPPSDARRKLDAVLDGIARKGPDHYVVPAEVVELSKSQPELLARGARVVPSIRGGKASGFKLYAIRPGSLFDRVGLANGDTLRAINGHSLASLDDAVGAYASLRSSSKLVVELTRRGAAKQLTIELAN